ncbi:hypothetical protein BJX76DRAFT_360795 [Aspergillus varians]
MQINIAPFIIIKEAKNKKKLLQPVLQGGQHRKAALIQLLDDQALAARNKNINADGQPIKNPEPMEYYWAV